MKKLSYLLLFLAIISLSGFLTSCDSPSPINNFTTPKLPEPPPEKTIVITAVGDIMMHNTQIKAGYNPQLGTYDFSPFFGKIKPLFSSSDFVIGNLETTLGTNPAQYSGYPCFNSPAILAQNLQEAGFDLLTTANNHSLDKGFAGVSNTLNHLDEVKLLHAGTARSQEERETLLFTDIQGIKTAFIAYTYGTNGIKPPKGKDFAVNYLDEEQIIYEIKKAQSEGAQLIVLYLHFGEEYMEQPNSTQTRLTQKFLQTGADIILGGHPHVLQPAMIHTLEEELKQPNEQNNGTNNEASNDITNENNVKPLEKKEKFVIYSLGNFISAQRGMPRKASIILNLHLGVNTATGKPYFKKAEYIPIWTRQYQKEGKTHFEVLPIETTLNSIRLGETKEFTMAEITELEEAWEHILSCFTGVNEDMALQTLKLN